MEVPEKEKKALEEEKEKSSAQHHTYRAVKLGSFPTTILQYVFHADFRACECVASRFASIGRLGVAQPGVLIGIAAVDT